MFPMGFRMKLLFGILRDLVFLRVPRGKTLTLVTLLSK